MRYLHCVVKSRWWKLGCALTWYENVVLQLRCASTESKSSLWKLRYASEIKKNQIALFALRFYCLKRSLRCAFLIMLFVPTSAVLYYL